MGNTGRLRGSLMGCARHDAKTGIVKLRVNNPAENQGKIIFAGSLQLGALRTKNADISVYLKKRNSANGNTNKSLRKIAHIYTTGCNAHDAHMYKQRAKLCFQVGFLAHSCTTNEFVHFVHTLEFHQRYSFCF